jgi:drug/metabolite transporter (DMT)-like permease
MSNLLGVLVSFAAAFCWGTLYAEVQTLDRAIPPFALLAVAYLIGCLVLSPYMFKHSEGIKKGISADPRDFLFCLLALVLAEALIFYSISLLGATEASLIEVSYPLWVCGLLYLTVNEKPTWATIVGGSLIMIGVVIIGYADRNNKPPS